MSSDTISLKIARFIFSYFDKIFDGRLTIKNVENIPEDKVIIFTPNHFTRFETIFIPYTIDKITGKTPMSLADKDLFKTFLKPFLEQVKVLSTGNPNRDKVIINHLVTGEENWVVYPEGMMVRDKHIFTRKHFINGYEFSARTGTAVIAIKSQIEKLRNPDKNYKELVIVPVSITYFPILTKHNRLKSIVEKFTKNVTKRAEEELLVEGGLLEYSNIEVSFNRPIAVKDFVQKTFDFYNKMPFCTNEFKDNLILDKLRKKLTYHIMDSVYSNIKVSISHVLACVLISLHEKKLLLKYDDIKTLTYAAILHYYEDVAKMDDNFNYVIGDYLKVKDSEFSKNIDLFVSQNLIKIDDARVVTFTDHVNFDFKNKNQFFYEIRIKNTLRVVYNEACYNRNLISIVHKLVEGGIKTLKGFLFKEIYKYDVERFKKEREVFIAEKDIKPEHLGKPSFFQAKNKSDKVGIVLSHGYKASPAELHSLAEFLSEHNVNVYLTRFKGHGTSSLDMKDTGWKDWSDYFTTGYEALRLRVENLYIGGFSTGGLIALDFFESRQPYDVSGVVCISAALKLNDFRFRFIKFAKVWGDITKGRDNGFIEDEPEYPDTNYSRNYICCMMQLSNLMDRVKENLGRVNVPLLVVSNKTDPVVNPEAAHIIYKLANSHDKTICDFEFPSHVIVRGENSGVVFEKILHFVAKS